MAPWLPGSREGIGVGMAGDARYVLLPPHHKGVVCCVHLGWCGAVWCGAVRCGVVWCRAVRCGVVWCGVVWCGAVRCSVVWCGAVRCGVVWCESLHHR